VDICGKWLPRWRRRSKPNLASARATRGPDRNGSLEKGNVGALVREYGRRAGLGRPITPHLWRHTCATHLVQNHANLRHVKELLGHGSLSTTERYLQLTITDLKEAHARFHPRERADMASERQTR
jgi:integrase/recombinase XerD